MARIIEEPLHIEVKATLHVDEQTFQMCMGLLRIYAKEHGWEKMIVDIDDNFYTGWRLETIEDVEKISYCPVCGRDIEVQDGKID